MVARPDPPRRALRRAVGGARRQLCDRDPRARRRSTWRGTGSRRSASRPTATGRSARPPGRPRRRAGGAPAAARPSGPSCRPVGAPARRDADAGRASPSCCRCCTARWARTARCRVCSSWPTCAYVGAGVLGSALAMDKAMAKQVLAANGIPQAAYRAFREHEHHARVCRPRWPTSSVCRASSSRRTWDRRSGVSKAHGVEELRDAIDYALTYDEWVVVEEAVAGREIEVAVLGGTAPLASGAGEIVPSDEFYGYEDKYVTDGAQLLIPAPLTAEQTDEVRGRWPWTCSRCCAATGSPASTSSSRRAGAGSCATRPTRCPGSPRSRCTRSCGRRPGCSYPALIDRLVELAIERQGTAPPQHQALTAEHPGPQAGQRAHGARRRRPDSASAGDHRASTLPLGRRRRR